MLTDQEILRQLSIIVARACSSLSSAVGPFQSDALLVPEHCTFDHIHDSKICTSYSEWNETSFRSCHDRDMIQQSFAMLQPCGIDKFNGVEFVCCPTEAGLMISLFFLLILFYSFINSALCLII